ncbi:hypothetical protein [Halorubrum sodomense]|uniref:Uncharacterized protein n=1 Tax=Halorubrum sodomense TaxID=35743 RepID=A0A1I6HZ18_HALSD|nr:hypothetical protein [Halorubrum sodomense]SFR59693.1 hypothetical protein SAMN04487937_2991 [Halorubrum sodomense]
MTGINSGGGGGYDYVEAAYPSDPDEGESLYHTDENRAFVYNGSAWVEQTVTDHSQLSGVGPDTHHPQDHGNEDHTATFETESGAQSRVDDHAVDADAHHAKTTSSSELTDVSPDSDASAHHGRYTDSEAANAAPVDDVNGQTGSVSISYSADQTGYNNVTSSRSLDTSYTNNTGNPLIVAVEVGPDGNCSEFDVGLNTGGTYNIDIFGLNLSSGTIDEFSNFGVSGIIPPGASYTVSANANGANPQLYRWNESELKIS